MISIKNLRMKPKLITMFLLAGLVPLAIVGIWSSTLASKALMKQSFNQLKAVQAIKKSQITQFFDERHGHLEVLLETVSSFDDATTNTLSTITANKGTAISLLANQWFIDIKAQQTSSVSTKGLAHFQQFIKSGSKSGDYKHNAQLINNFVKATGYYDYFIIDKSGLCVYSDAKEADYKTNLKNGRYKDSGLGRAFRRAIKGEIAIEDFTPYAPSNGEYAAFIAAPILDNGRTVGVVAMQISMEKIQEIVADRHGLGQTGESYMVGETNGKTSYRSNRVVKSGKIGQEKSGESIDTALAGVAGSRIKKGSKGDMEFEAYAPVDIPGLNWCIVTSMSLEEAFARKKAGEKDDFFTKYVKAYGYYDLFLIEPKGKVFYSASKEADYGTNMVNGKYANSGLGQLTRKVLSTKSYAVADFAPYAPSNNEPCAFIAMPLMHEGEVEVIVALQLSLEAINAVMQQREGMGETGESYLVGSDKLMRSDSFLDPQNHSVKASFANPTTGSVDTEAAREALAGKSGEKVIMDYNGNPVLSAYAPLQIGDTTWALLAEIDKAEVRGPVNSLIMTVVIVALIMAVIIAFGAYMVAIQIASPLAKGVDFAKTISEKDLSTRLDIDQEDEIGDLAKALNSMAEILSEMIGEIDGSVNTVSSSSTELASISDQLAAAADTTVQKSNTVSAAAEEMNSNMTSVASAMEQTSTNVSTVAAATDELSASIGEISQNAEQAKDAANNAVQQAQQASERVNELGTAAEEIGVVTETIRAISDKTDLLAMNATIEAARAGEAGKGFAVVASEIKDLAKKTAESTEDISTRLQGIQKTTGLTVTEIEEVSTVINKLDEIVGSIAAAVVQQNSATSEISENVGQTSLGIQEVNVNVTQSSEAAGQVASEISEVNEAANEMSNSSAQVQQSAGELSELSEQLKEIISQFKVR